MNYRSSIKIFIIYIINRLFSQINLKFLYHSCNSDKEKKCLFFFSTNLDQSVFLYILFLKQSFISVLICLSMVDLADCWDDSCTFHILSHMNK